MKLYEYAVICEPKIDRDGEEIEKGEIVVNPTTVLARDEAQAQLLAGRAIPENFVSNGKFDRLVVVVRPF